MKVVFSAGISLCLVGLWHVLYAMGTGLYEVQKPPTTLLIQYFGLMFFMPLIVGFTMMARSQFGVTQKINYLILIPASFAGLVAYSSFLELLCGRLLPMTFPLGYFFEHVNPLVSCLIVTLSTILIMSSIYLFLLSIGVIPVKRAKQLA